MSKALPDTILSEVVSASIGGAVSTSILYPLEVLKTRIQSSGGIDDDSADNDDADSGDREISSKGMFEYAKHLYEKEGYHVFFNGMETSALQSSLEKACYFFAYTALKQVHASLRQFVTGSNYTTPMSASTSLVLGCLAEWAHLPITMPVDCLTTAIQTSEKRNGTQLMLTILKEGNMYKGIQAYYILCFKPALQYTIFEQGKIVILKSRKSKSLTAAESFILGMFARTVATVAVFPFVRAKVIMQSRKASSSDNSSSRDGETIQDILKDIYDLNGIAGLYRGLGPELTRGVFSAALMLMIKEQLNGGIKGLLYGSDKPR